MPAGPRGYRIAWCPRCTAALDTVVRSHKARLHWRCVRCHHTYYDELEVQVDEVDRRTYDANLYQSVCNPGIKRQEFYQWLLAALTQSTASY